jgi:hypothetical protein
MYADDESHPVPSVDSLDLFAARRDGGARLVIIVAGPLQADERSQRRLLRKLENYVDFVNSDEFLQEHGAPDPSKVEIDVRIDTNSDAAVFALLGRAEAPLLENNVTLLVNSQPPQPPQ